MTTLDRDRYSQDTLINDGRMDFSVHSRDAVDAFVAEEIDPILDRLQHTEVRYETTYHCNSTCIMCPCDLHEDGRPHGVMGLAEYSRSIDEIIPLGARRVVLTGFGEPLMDSTLGRSSDIVVNVGVPQEACPLNLAPTSSSTAALAAGDAIAIALMKLKDFSADEYALHHPGGQLGKRLTLTVSEVMRSGQYNPTISSEDSIKTMLIRIAEGQAGAVSVVDSSNCLSGIVTDFDIRRALESEKNIFDFTIEDLMNPNPLSVQETMKAVEALALMSTSRKKRTSVLSVVDDQNHVVGMLHIADLVAAGI